MENVGVVRRHIESLQDIVRQSAPAGPDWRALRRVMALCQEASDALDDDYFRAKLHAVSEYAAELFANAEHGRWRRGSVSGTVYLTLQILNALELCNSRLYSLGAPQETGRLGAPSSIAHYREARP